MAPPAPWTLRQSSRPRPASPRSTSSAASRCSSWRRRSRACRSAGAGVPRRPRRVLRLPHARPPRVGRLLAVGPDPAVVHVHGRRGAAVLDRRAGGPRGERSAGMFGHALVPRAAAGRARRLPALAGARRRRTSRSRTCSRRSASATCSCSCWLDAARACSGRRPVAILVGYWAAFALYPLPPAGFDYATVGVPRRLAAPPAPASPPTGTRTPTSAHAFDRGS